MTSEERRYTALLEEMYKLSRTIQEMKISLRYVNKKVESLIYGPQKHFSNALLEDLKKHEREDENEQRKAS